MFHKLTMTNKTIILSFKVLGSKQDDNIFRLNHNERRICALFFMVCILSLNGVRGSVEALCYKPEGRGFDSK
jgi:hypothetical protein